MWSSEMVTILRVMVNDLSSPYTFSDGRLQQTILASAQLVQHELTFAQTYTVDIPNSGLSPDPTVSPRDNAFINLILLKSACLIDRGTTRTSLANGVKIVHGGDSIDTSVGSKSADILLSKGYCGAYEQAKLEYTTTGGGAAGEAILGPYTTLVSTGNYRFLNRGLC